MAIWDNQSESTKKMITDALKSVSKRIRRNKRKDKIINLFDIKKW